MDGSHLPETYMTNRPVGYVEFRQRCSADFHQLHISKTCILRIRSGRKTVRTFAGAETTVEQGEFVYLRRGENLTIGNIIGDTGLYFSECLVIDDSVISDFLQRHPNPSTAREIRKGVMPNGFNDAFSRVVASLDDPDLCDGILSYRTQELLMWLQLQGAEHRVHCCEGLKDRLRMLFEGDLERSWKAPQAARELGMSEATLRRTLSKEGTGFIEMLRDVRLSFALMRIQTTQHSLAEIAFECGFSSQSRLSEAFKARFDITPGKLRASEAQLERIA
ncbi:AraC family transcriptional regulator [Phaeobacter sp. 11ANDIMAR09]|uniref:helix-turn-helix transcriptional regulator n=1 Tax=Phaeobacter sp. 11ANDIMAR09 TaxID=1225647 RepID=UPI0006C8CB43|nr:AraC family transcriptional regulator [Phaeobacter sp. 11ANDIMAR09]KPD11524.1 hypothetical protein AN476_14850 [Phaeobacter sp. 11ANDIMAR09]